MYQSTYGKDAKPDMQPTGQFKDNPNSIFIAPPHSQMRLQISKDMASTLNLLELWILIVMG